MDHELQILVILTFVGGYNKELNNHILWDNFKFLGYLS